MLTDLLLRSHNVFCMDDFVAKQIGDDFGGNNQGLQEVLWSKAISCGGNINQLKDKLVHLIRSPEKRKLMGEKGRYLVESKFKLDLMVDLIERKYLEIYWKKNEKLCS